MIQLPSALREPKCAQIAREKRKRIALTFAIIFAILALMNCEYRYIMLNLSPSVSETGSIHIEIFGQVDEYNANANVCSVTGTFYSGMDAIN